MPRYFSHQQASRLLPEVERLLRAALNARTRYEEAEQELAGVQDRIRMMGGVSVDRERIRGFGHAREEAAREMKESIESMTELGVQIKDLNIGLVDFPTLYREEEVLLCWRLGEPMISHWHGLEEGFRGRKPIDSEFLDHHRGGGSH
jgi:hypothetical protein